MADKKSSKAKSSVKNRKGSESAAVQKFLPIAEIKNDAVLLKNGGMRAVLSVSSMNFSLKSEEEQEAIISSYQQFINTLSFPIQIVVRSTKMNVDSYVGKLREKTEKQENPLLREQTLDYAAFIERLVDVSDIMQKKFYLIVPVDPVTGGKVSFFGKYMSWLTPGDSSAKAASRKSRFEDLSAKLRDYVNIVQTGLEGIGLKSDRLHTSELIELFYEIYNPTTSQEQKIGGAELGVKGYVL